MIDAPALVVKPGQYLLTFCIYGFKMDVYTFERMLKYGTDSK